MLNGTTFKTSIFDNNIQKLKELNDNNRQEYKPLIDFLKNKDVVETSHTTVTNQFLKQEMINHIISLNYPATFIESLSKDVSNTLQLYYEQKDFFEELLKCHHNSYRMIKQKDIELEKERDKTVKNARRNIFLAENYSSVPCNSNLVEERTKQTYENVINDIMKKSSHQGKWRFLDNTVYTGFQKLTDKLDIYRVSNKAKLMTYCNIETYLDIKSGSSFNVFEDENIKRIHNIFTSQPNRSKLVYLNGLDQLVRKYTCEIKYNTDKGAYDFSTSYEEGLIFDENEQYGKGYNLIQSVFNHSSQDLGFTAPTLCPFDHKIQKQTILRHPLNSQRPLVFYGEFKEHGNCENMNRPYEECIIKVVRKDVEEKELEGLLYEYNVLKYISNNRKSDQKPKNQRATSWISDKEYIGFITQPVGNLLKNKPKSTGIQTWIKYMKSIHDCYKEAHDLGIVNCDSSPHNLIFIEEGDEAIPIDWGLALPIGTEITRFRGTVDFISISQQREKHKIQKRDDFEALFMCFLFFLNNFSIPWKPKETKQLIHEWETIVKIIQTNRPFEDISRPEIQQSWQLIDKIQKKLYHNFDFNNPLEVDNLFD